MTPVGLLGDATALIVDWDGTVADTAAARHAALQAALAPHGVTVAAGRYRAPAGLPVREVIAQLTADFADGFAALAAGMRTLTIRDGRLVPAHAPSPSGAPCAAQS